MIDIHQASPEIDRMHGSDWKPAQLAASHGAWLLTIVYSLFHGVMLLNHGLYWDDWCIVGCDPLLVANHLDSLGIPLLSSLHGFFSALPWPVAAYRIATFGCYLGAALALYSILRTMHQIDPVTRLAVCSLFALIPVNTARISIACFHYAVCYLLFFSAFWCASRFTSSGRLGWRLAVLALAALSFSTMSLLAFYPLIVAYLIYRNVAALRTGRRAAFGLAVRHLDFLLLPLVYSVFRLAFWKPEDAGYNHITLGGLRNAEGIERTLNHLLYGMCYGIFPEWPRRTAYILFAGVALITLWPFRKRFVADTGTCLLLMSLGGVMLILGIYPYVAVGKIPRPFDWDDRHQLLMPLGISFIICFGLAALLDRSPALRRLKHALLIASVLAAGTMTMHRHLEYQRDWYKQLAVMRSMSSNDLIRRNTSFWINDLTNDFNPLDQVFRFYEYCGMMKMVFADETRYARNLDETGTEIPDLHDFIPGNFNVNNYRHRDPRVRVEIHADRLPSVYAVMSAMFWERVDETRFDAWIHDLLVVDACPMTPR